VRERLGGWATTDDEQRGALGLLDEHDNLVALGGNELGLQAEPIAGGEEQGVRLALMMLDELGRRRECRTEIVQVVRLPRAYDPQR
jgi:hypothetical protein